MKRLLALGVIAVAALANGQDPRSADASHSAAPSVVHSRTHNRPAGWGDCGARTEQKGCRDPFLRRRHRVHGDHDGYEQPAKRHTRVRVQKTARSEVWSR